MHRFIWSYIDLYEFTLYCVDLCTFVAGTSFLCVLPCLYMVLNSFICVYEPIWPQKPDPVLQPGRGVGRIGRASGPGRQADRAGGRHSP